MLKKLNYFRLTGIRTLVLLRWKWMDLVLRKNHLLRCWGWFSLLNWIGAPALSLLLKIGAFIRSMKLLSVEVVLYLYKSTITAMYGMLLSYLGWSSKLLLGIADMQDCWSFTCFLSWTLGSSRNVASLSLFYRYDFGRCSSELAQLVLLPYSRGRSTRYSYRLHDFSVTIPRCYKDAYVHIFSLRTARPWNSLPIECFPLTYDLSDFKSKINRHLLTVGFF